MKNIPMSLVNVSMRLSGETKEYFEELFQESGSSSKGEFIKDLLDKYTMPEPKPQPRPEPEIIEKIVEVEKPVEVERIVEVERSIQENEIVIKLNKLQSYLIEVLTTKTQCRKEANADFDNINNGVDKSFWGNKIFSGDYSGLFNNYTCEDTPEKTKEDMGAYLVNTFMMVVAKGYFEAIGVNADYIKQLRNHIEKEEKESL